MRKIQYRAEHADMFVKLKLMQFIQNCMLRK